MSEKLGANNRNISKYEAGTTQPSYEMLCDLASIFDCSTDYILGRTHHRSCVMGKVSIENSDYYEEIKKEIMIRLTTKQKLELIKELMNNTVK